MVETRWNPWRALRSREHLTLQWGKLDGIGGQIVAAGAGRAVIWLDRRLDGVGRCAVLTHELIHEERGLLYTSATPRPLVEKEEAIVTVETARRLVPFVGLEALYKADLPVELWEVAERFDVPEAVALTAVRDYFRRR